MTRQAFTPRPYQHAIVSHALDRARCGVWAGMGLGKTVATLTALDSLFLSGEETRPALVVAPLRVAQSTWPDEAAKWDHLREIEIQPIVGSADDRKLALRRSASVYTINYENLPWLTEYLDGAWPFGTVVADESTRLKGFRLKQGTQRAKAIARVAHTRCSRWVNLTGTPAPNGLIDLWGQSWFIDAGQRLGRTFTAFAQRWFHKDYTGFGLSPHPFAREEIEAKLRDVCLSLKAENYFDLQEPITNTIFVELPRKSRDLYRQMEREFFMEIEDHAVEAFNAAAKSMKLLQLANGAVYVDEDSGVFKEVHDAKIQALESVVEEAAGNPVLVAYHFRSDLDRLRHAFPCARTLDNDPQTIRDWNAGKIPVLFAHPASAGHGLNLQDGGNILAFFGHWWDLEQYQQIIERIGPTRQAQAGHDRPVFIHHIVARDTLDEIVMARRESKREIQDLLMEAMKRRGQ